MLYSALAMVLFVLVFFRFNRSRFTVGFVSCGLIRSLILRYLRRFALLSSIDYVFYTLVITTIYVAIGPWFLGEILENQLGVCFSWGIYLLNGTLLSVDFQYLAGYLHV